MALLIEVGAERALLLSGSMTSKVVCRGVVALASCCRPVEIRCCFCLCLFPTQSEKRLQSHEHRPAKRVSASVFVPLNGPLAHP